MFFKNWSVIKRLLLALGIYGALCVLWLLDALLLNGSLGLRGFCLAIFVGNSVFLHFLVLRPLKAINKQYLRFAQGYDSRALFSQTDYLLLAEKKALQKMGERLESHEVNRLSTRQAQYLALQNQINPHFLYNTLEAIRGEALSEGVHNIAMITEALATFFRYTISNVDHLVTLEEEIDNAENYFAIQSYRFGDRIHMQVEIEPGCEAVRDFKLPKLILQPIIENAIIHGLECRIGQGKIVVRIRSDEPRLLIEVSDDGVGMSESVLDEINQQLKRAESAASDKARGGHIALLNVNHRIRLLFGDAYGLRVSSIKGLGTRVEINLPTEPKAE